MKILISAAETSSDAHAAELLRAIRSLSGEEVEAFGIGGPKLAVQRQRQIVDARELLSMGFVEILGRLPKIYSALRRVERAARQEKPDVAVFLDYPDFHFRLARRLSKLGIPLVYYIPPKVWVWRKGRVRFLRRFFKRILCILPFEEKFYRDSQVPVRYVGNPLQDELPLDLTREEARVRLGLRPENRVLAVLVGSRPLELKRHLDVFLDGAEKTAEALNEKLIVLLPFAATSDLSALRARVDRWIAGSERKIEVRVSQGDSGCAMRAADVGLIKSGTSTLEAGLLGLPHVIAYRPNALTCFIVKRLIRYQGPIGLSNLVAGVRERPYLIPELNCSAVTPDAIADRLVPLFSETSEAREMKSSLEKIRAAVLHGQESPSVVAAREVLSVIQEFR